GSGPSGQPDGAARKIQPPGSSQVATDHAGTDISCAVVPDKGANLPVEQPQCVKGGPADRTFAANRALTSAHVTCGKPSGRQG
ncbi:MAG: hypothetical protein J2P29_06205, partial [Actinobacteria bacterium]|nr:hypothetical protein [Actinomycetota bacterium]